jgi:hypothetical protein
MARLYDQISDGPSLIVDEKVCHVPDAAIARFNPIAGNLGAASKVHVSVRLAIAGKHPAAGRRQYAGQIRRVSWKSRAGGRAEACRPVLLIAVVAKVVCLELARNRKVGSDIGTALYLTPRDVQRNRAPGQIDQIYGVRRNQCNTGSI